VSDGGNDSLDVGTDTGQRSYWITASVSRSSMPYAVLHHLDGSGQVTACPVHAAQRVNRALIPHPTLPFVYAVDSGFAGISLGCDSDSYLGSVQIGAARATQRIAYEPSLMTGYFTVDGPGALGLYRFTTAADGTPTITSSTDTSPNSGPLALDAQRATLITAAPNAAAAYVLTGSTLDLPTTNVTAPGCAQPIDLASSGGYTLLFCADTSQIFRYTTSPFALESQIPGPGPVDRIVALPGDRAIAATTAPALGLISLSNGSPTWSIGPTIESRVTAMAVSQDGEILATARMTNTFAELALWRVAGQSITPLATLPISGGVFALAITTAGD